MKYTIKAPSQLNASINLPASKSISNRALVISAMAGSNIQPDNLSDCDEYRGDYCSPQGYARGHQHQSCRYCHAIHDCLPGFYRR